jgi:hypothetical protein
MFAMSTSLEKALQRFRSRPVGGVPGEVAGRVSAAAFEAAMEQRMRNLEQDVSEVKNRVNGLIFLVAGTVVTQVLMKVLA